MPKCSDVNVTKVSGCDDFQWRLRVNNRECKFYEIVGSNERGFGDLVKSMIFSAWLMVNKSRCEGGSR